MKFTRSWLQEYVSDSELDTAQLAEKLTMLGLEVEAVQELYQDLAPLRTGHILSAEKHPDADRLQVCEVQVGEEILQIVCGAPNARKGLNVVVALPGVVLPGSFKIKKSKVRGVASAGMMCSERELGLSEEHNGIMELPADVAHGQSFVEVMGLADTMIEVDLTPNRPDCTSVIGIAREIAGSIEKPLRVPVTDRVISAEDSRFAVDIESPEYCPRYAARMITGVKIGPSPWWLRNRLLSVGLRPINVVVDVTNYVMLEYGQPLHAFDFESLAGSRIVVRLPRVDEKTFTTLDGTERALSAETLLICDAEKPVALAGIMGGLNSEVTDETTTVLLESACFDPVSVRRAARRMRLSTDASYRFERGVDPEGTVNAMDRAVELLCELAGGVAEPCGIDLFPGKRPVNVQQLRISRTGRLLGVELDQERIVKLLESIGFRCQIEDKDTLNVEAPSFRVDIEREADLIEEVARLYGYDNIPTSLPQAALSYPEQDASRLKRFDVNAMMLAIGYTEAINYSFTDESYADSLGLDADDERRNFVRLLNPLSKEQGVLRTTLLPGLLENVKRNLSFQKTSVRLFEIGKVFWPLGADSLPHETMFLGGVLCGNKHGENSPLYFPAEPVDIFDAKGVVEYLLEELRIHNIPDNDVVFVQPVDEGLENFVDPDYALLVFVGEHFLGSIGKIDAEVLRNFGIKCEVYYFELNFDEICELQGGSHQFAALPVFPAVKRDVALVVPDTVSAGELLKTVCSSREKLVESAEIFDVFQGGNIKKGFKSVAVSITYRSATKTLTEKNVEKVHNKIVKILTDTYGGSFREA